jgi:hypothetical protein
MITYCFIIYLFIDTTLMPKVMYSEMKTERIAYKLGLKIFIE